MHAVWLGLLCMLVSLRLSQCSISKLPSWRGPTAFLDGTLPFNRADHGFVSSDDGRIYAFGGILFFGGETGEWLYVCTGTNA